MWLAIPGNYSLSLYLWGWLAGIGTERLALSFRKPAQQFMALVAIVAAAILIVKSTPSMALYRKQYEQVGIWLKHHTRPGTTVAAAEIGRIGFYSDRTMVDYLGLLDARAVPHIRAADWAWWVSELHPDYWVKFRPDDGTEWPIDASIKQVALRAGYRPVHETANLTIYSAAAQVSTVR